MPQRNLVFTANGWGDYVFWLDQDKKTVKKINLLIKDIQRDPLTGLGKPEILRENYSGTLSRRIDNKNRLIYDITEKSIYVISCRFHYK